MYLQAPIDLQECVAVTKEGAVVIQEAEKARGDDGGRHKRRAGYADRADVGHKKKKPRTWHAVVKRKREEVDAVVTAKRNRVDLGAGNKRRRAEAQGCESKKKQHKLCWDVKCRKSDDSADPCLINVKPNAGDGNQVDLLIGTVARGVD